jgi:alpha-1,6-mannosyltransferase
MKPPSTVDPAAPPSATEGPSRPAGSATATSPPATGAVAAGTPRRSWGARLGAPPRGPLLLGLTASLMMVIGGFGAGAVLVRDPLLSNSVIGLWR